MGQMRAVQMSETAAKVAASGPILKVLGEGELFQEIAVRHRGLQNQVPVGIARGLLEDLYSLVPIMLTCPERLREEMVEIELCGGAIPILSVVELHTRTQLEDDTVGGFGPTLRQRRQNCDA